MLALLPQGPVWWPRRSRGWWVALVGDGGCMLHCRRRHILSLHAPLLPGEVDNTIRLHIPGSPEPQHTHQFSKDCNAVPWHTCQSDGMVNINLAPTSNASMSSTSRWSSPQRPRKATSALNNRKELPLRNHSQSRWKNWTAYVWILLTDIGCDRPFIYKWWQLTIYVERWNY